MIGIGFIGKQILKDINLTVRPDDKIFLIGTNEIAKTALLNIMAGVITPDSGIVKYGSTVNLSYFENRLPQACYHQKSQTPSAHAAAPALPIPAWHYVHFSREQESSFLAWFPALHIESWILLILLLPRLHPWFPYS